MQKTLTATAAIPTPQQKDPTPLCKINYDDEIEGICTKFEAQKIPKKEDSMYELASICKPIVALGQFTLHLIHLLQQTQQIHVRVCSCHQKSH